MRALVVRVVTVAPILQAAPFYRIFVADARAPRDGKHVDVVGHFDPIPGVVCDKASTAAERVLSVLLSN